MENTVDMNGGHLVEPKKEELICPYCGNDVNTAPEIVSEDDKKEYFRRMMSGTRFEKEYTYLKGDVVIKLREPSTEETDKLIDFVRSVEDDQMILAHAFRAKLIVCCTHFRVGENTIIDSPPKELKSMESLNKIFSDTIGKLQPTISHLADDAVRDFTALIDGIVQAAVTSRDF